MSVDFAFLHGGGQGGWVWAETVAALEAQTGGGYGRALLLDVPGCGAKRGYDTDGLGQADVGRALVADIEAAGFSDVVLVGHSQAGQTLPLMAALRPGLFRGLVYLACSAPLPGQSVGEMLGDGVHGSDPHTVGWPLDPATTTIAERMPAMFCNDMAEGEAKAFLAKLGADSWPADTYLERDWSYDHLDAIPSSFVICLQDMALPVPWQHVFADRLRVRRRVVLDAGHQAMLTRPHGLAEILRFEAASLGA